MAQTFKEKMQSLLDGIGDAVNDFATLDVVTLSGDLKLLVNSEDNKKRFFKPLEIVDKFSGQADGKVVIEAFTHIDFDQDKVQYVKEGIKNDDLSYQIHTEAVKSSIEARQAMLNFVREIVGA